MNSKENWLAIYRGEPADRIPYTWEPFEGEMDNCFVLDPQFQSDSIKPGTSGKDSWGVTWMWHEGAQGPHPVVTPETAVITDIEYWREQVTVPDPTKLDYSHCAEVAAKVNRDEKMVITFSNMGMFERSHHLQGIENALVNYMTEPEAMYDLVGAICDFKLQLTDCLYEATHPDIMLFLDDWGNATNLFLPPEVWRECIKPHAQRLIDRVHSHGAIYMHHADCVCLPILEDMIEMGIDIWQGIITENDIPAVQEQVGDRMCMIGGMRNKIIDDVHVTEEQIRAEVRRAVEEYGGPGKRFFPCLPSLIWPVDPANNRFIEDEMTNYGREFYQKCLNG